MVSKTIVLTGASDGIGAAAARKLTADGHQVVLVGRSKAKTSAIAGELGADYYLADFAELASVRALAASLLERYPRIDVLANNAGGIFAKERALTVDGHEMTFQVNYLAPFLLTALLRDLLAASAPARVITTASVANLSGFVRLNDLESRLFFTGYTVYGTTKLENILFTRELGRRLAGTGVLATCFNPGAVATDLARGTLIGAAYQLPLSRLLMKSPEHGADTLVWLVTQPADRLRQGGYYSNRRPGLLNPQALSGPLARQLWEQTERILDTAEDGT
jgi:NAD(P)-dependent dehydrogenase (short-subunit alcohol dehydrogenase family)